MQFLSEREHFDQTASLEIDQTLCSVRCYFADSFFWDSSRKHAHVINSNLQICKNDDFQSFFLNIFLIFAQNIDCGYTLEPPQRGGSNEYPQSMFWSKNKKNMYTRINPTFSI